MKTCAVQILIGTSGWAYKPWKGTFYPSTVKSDEMLRYYAGRFPAVEINNSFYRMPTEKVLLTWAAQVHDAFRFVLKAPRRITHIQRLADEDGSLAYFLNTANVLGERLGATLFQCPPSLKKDIVRLRDFLVRVPRTWHAALEFRHASWFDDEVYETLNAHDVPLVVTEDDDETTPFMPTASWGYLRLRRTEYDDRALGMWMRQIESQQWQQAFIFFKHDEEGTKGPVAAEKLLAMSP